MTVPLEPNNAKHSNADENILIAVMGATGSGKTTFINLVSGSKLRVGRGLQSCTSDVQLANAFQMDGRWVTLIDTPGFDDTHVSDTDVLKKIAAFLATAYQRKATLSGVLYFHRISDFRVGGTSARNFRMFKTLCGDETLKNVVLVTNMWGEVSRDLGEFREQELQSKDIFFKPVLDRGAQYRRHENTLASGHAILRMIMKNHPLPLQIQRELVDEEKDITETLAAKVLNKELTEQIKKHKEEMRAIREEMAEALKEKDEETRKILEAESRKLQADVNRIQKDYQNLATSYKDEKGKLEAMLKHTMETAKHEAANIAEQHRKEIEALRKQLNEAQASGGGGFTLVCCIQ